MPTTLLQFPICLKTYGFQVIKNIQQRSGTLCFFGKSGENWAHTKISIAMQTGPYTFLSTGLPIIMSQVFYTKPHRTKWRYHQIIIALWSDYYLIFLTLPYLTNPKISTKIGQGYVNCSHKNQPHLTPNQKKLLMKQRSYQNGDRKQINNASKLLTRLNILFIILIRDLSKHFRY